MHERVESTRKSMTSKVKSYVKQLLKSRGIADPDINDYMTARPQNTDDERIAVNRNIIMTICQTMSEKVYTRDTVYLDNYLRNGVAYKMSRNSVCMKRLEHRYSHRYFLSKFHDNVDVKAHSFKLTSLEQHMSVFGRNDHRLGELLPRKIVSATIAMGNVTVNYISCNVRTIDMITEYIL